ncbi:hypothetical protein TPHA_0H01200 [Tetrapisispora phaffii CBS 4417]|uniref:Spindle pole body component n=1 Tax=Tetrapisispora phaffii (strain ATCC 24235 / CBS 4417 / NBRC 1672 / NRRL Y-8282 / UCD 70-5) TaxID=1071381 RepID=G8BX24_TETPH|nr:hypothetical protein TPHA_0H01200 [Tetrapisispora phaffii CBS 4417]CCE64328.1 hypothetical protein TPHA_0H01200 [Tetrapisispora phaffii CBS 4417]
MEIKDVEDNVKLLESINDLDLSGDFLDPPFLGRQVNYQPLSNTDSKIKTYPLNLLSDPKQSRIQESLVVHDLLNIILGLEGAYIRYNNAYSPYSDNTIPEFKIAKMMDSSLKSICHRIIKLGQLYIILTKLSEKWSDLKYGKTLQRLSFEIRHFLHETYLKFVVDTLENEYKNNPTFTIRDFEQLTNAHDISKKMRLLYDICSKIQKEMEERQAMDHMQEDFNNFMNDLKEQSQFKNGMILVTDTSLQSIAKGGIILKILKNLIQENLGDRVSIEFLKTILNSVAIDYYKMLNSWLIQGELEDPYEEFMIMDTMKNEDTISSTLKFGDRVWDTQYIIRKDGLLDEFSLSDGSDRLFKVLMTGKLLNVVKMSYNIVQLPIDETEPIETPTFVDLMESTNLDIYIDKWYKRANKMCLDMYLENYDLIHFIRLLQKHYFGYQNGNHLHKFLSKNMFDLTRYYSSKNHEHLELRFQGNLEAEKLSRQDEDDIVLKLLNLQLDTQSFEKVVSQYINESNFVNSSESAFGNNNMKKDSIFEASNFQTLREMLVEDVESDKLTEKSIKSTIHYIQHEVIIPFPLNVIVTRTSMVQFQIISRYTYLLQYYSKLLDDTWYEINKNLIWRYNGFSMEIKRNIIQKCRITHNKMNKFVKVILEYYSQNVIEAEMTNFINFSNLNGTNIIDWQLNLQECLTNIMTNCCLSQMFQMQLQIFEIIYKFCKFITSMRRTLCKIDPILFDRYLSHKNESDYNDIKEHDETKSYIFNEEEAISKIIPELLYYTNGMSNSFEQHRAAFMEGLNHYYHRNRTATKSAKNINPSFFNSSNTTTTTTNSNYNTERLINALGQ